MDILDHFNRLNIDDLDIIIVHFISECVNVYDSSSKISGYDLYDLFLRWFDFCYNIESHAYVHYTAFITSFIKHVKHYTILNNHYVFDISVCSFD